MMKAASGEEEEEEEGRRIFIFYFLGGFSVGSGENIEKYMLSSYS